MDKKTRNIALTTIALVGMASLGYIWANYGLRPDKAEVSEIMTKNEKQILLEGKVVPEKNADLGFIIPATIKSIAKQAGDNVKKGEILATQDGTDLQAGVISAQAALSAAQAELDKVNHDLKKEKLKLHGLSSYERRQQQAQISSSKDDVAMQESAIVSAREAVISAKAQLEKTLLRAPFDGVITRQDGEIGEVGGVSSPSFLTISSNEPLRKIESYASDLDVAKLKIGQGAQVTFDVLGAQKTMTAKVSAIDPIANENQGKSTYKVTLMLDETDPAIKAGMHAGVAFQLN